VQQCRAWGYDAATVAAHDPEPAVERRWSEWTISSVGALVVVAGFILSGEAARRPVVVPLDAALTMIALAVGALTWRRSPRQAVAGVLGFAATPSVVFAGIWIWLARDATLIGEGYADTIHAMFLYVCAVVGFVVTLTAGYVIAGGATRGPAHTSERRVRRAAQASLTLLVFVALLGTWSATRRPPYEQWLTSLPLRADLGSPATWRSDAWSTATTSDRDAATYHRDVRVDGQLLRVFQHVGRNQFEVCWQGLSFRGTPAGWSSGARHCTRPDYIDGAAVRVRRDDDRGLWVIDHGGRHSSAAFNDLGARVGPTYASILSSAAPPLSWVVSAWVAVLFAVALLRWPRPSVGIAAPFVAPYRPRPAADAPDDPARLRDAFALTLCALHSSPLVAYYLRAALG